tara:strand:- start:4834 stop:6363 length:1530 start_codon:yes stop_codon:yes gene_type:complete
MSWSSDFVNALSASSITPIYELEIVRSTRGVGSPATFFTHRGSLRVTRASVQGTQVIPHRWSVSFGGFEVELVGDILQYTQSLMRGCIAFLSVRLKGLTGKQLISIGQLDQIRGQRGVYRATFKDLLSAFQSRIDTRVVSGRQYSQLFFDTAIQTTAAHAWNNHNYLEVADGSAFTKSSIHRGLLYCIPSSGDPFYLGWNSYDPSTQRFALSSTTGVHPTLGSSTTLQNGDKIFNAVRIASAPHAIFAQIVTSTGAGTNGPNDVLPNSYGTGVPLPHSFFDAADAQSTNTYITNASGGPYALDFSAIAPLTNGLRGIADIFSTVGQWPVMRQNSFSWRGCFDPTGRFGRQPATAAHITDADIIELDDVDFFDANLKAVFMQSSMIYNTSGTSVVRTNSFAKSLPTNGSINRDFGFYYNPSFDEESMGQADRDRMAIWDFYNWARVSMRVSLKFAGLCAGDKVEVSSRFIIDTFTQPDRTYTRRPAMVLEIGYNINNRTCDLVIGVPPLF